MPIKLTKRAVDQLEAGETRTYVFDTDLAGFGIAVTPGEVKTFFVQYRTVGGRSGQKRRVTLGRYGALTVEEARALARRMLAEVAGGADPATTRSDRKTASTVAELGKEYLADVEVRRKPTTAVEYVRLWNKHVVPAIGAHKVTDITPAQVAALHRRLHDVPYMANRVLAVLGAFFSYAEQQGARSALANPARSVEPFPETARERFLTPAEMTRLGAALVRAEKTGLPPWRDRRRATEKTAKHRPKASGIPVPANPYAVAAIRFLLLTGWREREALNLRWTELDLKRGVATLPDTKTGRSIRSIGAAARALLSKLPRQGKSPFVFPSATPDRPLVNVNAVWYAVRNVAKLNDVRLHDLRHSFASVSASSGGSLLVIGKLLGHRDTATTAKYAHLFDDPVKAAADLTAKQIAKWMGKRT
ncbi:MAG: tyrosine-type recombinase/integrase [Gemmatimonadaceae bacterium]